MKRPSHTRPFAKKSLGQNFLTDLHFVNKIVEALNLSIDDTVIEIGPGRAALTQKLVGSGASVTVIELDRTLAQELDDLFVDDPNFNLIEGDALEIDFGSIVTRN